ncbi:MAG TPA: chemotaxis protein CheB [Anditalea sp.]|nr:chemotaxis protein CheB [Anditalea sp.]
MPNNKDKFTNNSTSKVIVIGASAGGMDALIKLLAQLQKDFPAPILVVQHLSPEITGEVLIKSYNNKTNLTCEIAQNGTSLKNGHVYMAPADFHLMIGDDERILITKGAHENRARPAIDPLFRSTAVVFGNRVISIILTGYLDDGTAGSIVVKRCGGTCIVQDPEEAQYPDMPQNVINQIEVDYILPLAEMGGLLYSLLATKIGKRKPVPKDILVESEIAKKVLSDLASVNALGDQVPFNCPGCGGVLWQVDKGDSLRYRCHTGHAYTAQYLLEEQNKRIEETMWVALRMFEERKNLLTTMSKQMKGKSAKSAMERAEFSQKHIDRIKSILHSD